jgi:hypothetical protein
MHLRRTSSTVLPAFATLLSVGVAGHSLAAASGPRAPQDAAVSAAAPMPESVARALAWIPEDAISFLAIPNLKRTSDDLAQLIEATGQGGVLAMGRPIDLLKGQLGIGASLDEKAPLVAYFPRGSAPADGAETLQIPVVVVGVTDATAFVAANLKPAPDAGEGAYSTANGTVVFVQELPGRVAVATARAMLPGDAAFRGIAERFDARLAADERAWLERADLVAWASRDALHESVERARKMEIPEPGADAAIPGGFAGNPEDREAFRQRSLDAMDMLADGILVVDADPLGLFVATVGVAEPSSRLASIAAGGAGEGARFDRIPAKPFYFAISADFDGLGGVAKFGELLDFSGIGRDMVPAWIFEEGADLSGVQLGASPSKLGVAIGGALNDSALFLASRNPSRTVARMKSSLLALAGESAGLRREPAWNDEKTLKSGAKAMAFELKETVVDATQRPGLDFERLAKQFIFGARGLNGLAALRDDGVVVTFSQRPDVYQSAIDAAGGQRTLARDETVLSLEEWLPARRDVEAMVGVGRVVALVSQIASSFVSEEQVKSMTPAIPADAEPVAIALEVDKGRVRSVFVVPTAVLGAIAASGARNALGGGAGEGAQPAPASGVGEAPEPQPATQPDASGADAR